MPGALTVTRRFVLRGDCMLPLLEDGDEVFVRTRGPESAGLQAYVRWKGDEPALVVRRRPGDGSRTRADSRLRPDAPGDLGEPAGAVVGFLRGGRFVALGSWRARVWGAFSRAYARLFFCWWRERVLLRLRSSGGLRRASLAPARLVFRLLFG
jgi:hypothetical protein